MLKDGQQVPIKVRADGERFVLIEGLHRLEAARSLGEHHHHRLPGRRAEALSEALSRDCLNPAAGRARLNASGAGGFVMRLSALCFRCWPSLCAGFDAGARRRC